MQEQRILWFGIWTINSKEPHLYIDNNICTDFLKLCIISWSLICIVTTARHFFNCKMITTIHAIIYRFLSTIQLFISCSDGWTAVSAHAGKVY
jgi:hypothetical protein